MTSTAEETTEIDIDVDPMNEKILWSSISRNGVILVEAGDDPFDGAVSQTAHGILNKKATPGWEYHTLKNGDGWFGGGRKSVTASSTSAALPDGEEDNSNKRQPKLKAVKFHVYEHSTSTDSFDNTAVAVNAGNSGKTDLDNDDEPMIWVFAAVYNPEATSWENPKHALPDVKSFLEKIVGLTDMPRACDPQWRAGGTLACQASFAPILLQRMQEVTYLGKMARLHESLEGATELMQSNITAIIDREEKLSALEERGSRLEEAASVFKKSTKSVRRRMMMQNAKHGVVLGSLITGAVAVAVVPPLVAIL